MGEGLEYAVLMLGFGLCVSALGVAATLRRGSKIGFGFAMLGLFITSVAVEGLRQVLR